MKEIFISVVFAFLVSGASKPGQILENISVAEHSFFTEEEIKEIDKICSQE